MHYPSLRITGASSPVRGLRATGLSERRQSASLCVTSAISTVRIRATGTPERDQLVSALLSTINLMRSIRAADSPVRRQSAARHCTGH